MASKKITMPSSVISAMFYDERKRALTVVYTGRRGVYRYHDVSPEDYAAFRAAPSKGTHLNQIFKPRHPTFERLHSTQIIHLVRNAKIQDAKEKPEPTHYGEDHRRSHR
ncbi:MAG TPA: KTSC domain-containing protein [Edaphobacter sp.]